MSEMVCLLAGLIKEDCTMADLAVLNLATMGVAPCQDFTT